MNNRDCERERRPLVVEIMYRKPLQKKKSMERQLTEDRSRSSGPPCTILGF